MRLWLGMWDRMVAESGPEGVLELDGPLTCPFPMGHGGPGRESDGCQVTWTHCSLLQSRW